MATPATATRQRLGEILVTLGALSNEELGAALANGRETGRRLGEVLLAEEIVKPVDLLRALAVQYDVEFVDLESAAIDPEVVRRVPAHVARGHRAVPYRRQDDVIVVAMANPIDVVAVDDLRNLLGTKVRPVMADPDQILSAIERGASADSQVEELLAEVADDVIDDVPVVATSTADAPLVRFVDLLMARAVQERASDVHIEPSSDGLRVRFRVDGVLRDTLEPPAGLQAGLLSRVKVMADLDIAERRRPQDGRTAIVVAGETIDVRVATVPTVHGEAAVLRILRPEKGVASLEGIDLLKSQLEVVEAAIARTWGMIVVTGPTGSGKTTSLYGVIQSLNSPDRAIVTVEDPVEYRLDGLKQVQVNPKAGLTFSTAMRSFLRLDPDIMLVGEMRDAETASTAVESALTGHLVLSTLHTNDASSAAVRMIEMGVEPYLISASMVLVTAQRLVRRLCTQCRRPEAVEASALEGLDAPGELIRDGRLVVGVPVGCERCGGSGYRGRLAVHEVLPFTEDLGELVVSGVPASRVRAAAIANGMITLRQAGFYRVAEGSTTLDEVLKIST